MKITEIRLSTILLVVTLLSIMFVSPPLFFAERYSLYSINKFVILGASTILLMVLFLRPKIKKIHQHLIFIVFTQFVFIMFLPLVHGAFGYQIETGYLSPASQILVGLVVFIVFASFNKIPLIAKIWVDSHLLLGVMGLIAFIGGLFYGLLPLEEFGVRPYYDFGLTYTNSFYSIADSTIIRVAGFYDEPGTFAFFMTLALVIARVYGMSKWKEYGLILLGLFSLSMSFAIISFVWVLFSFDKKFIFSVLVATLVVTNLALITDNSVIDKLTHVTIDRFSSTGKNSRLVKGDNRSKIMFENYIAFVDAPIIGHGVNYKENTNGKYGHSFIANPVAILARHGLIGAFIFVLHIVMLFYYLLKSRRITLNNKFTISFVLLLLLAQRPEVIVGAIGYLLFLVITNSFLDSDEDANKQGLP